VPIRIIDESGEVYAIATDAALGENARRSRASPPRGPRSHFWQIEIGSDGDPDFEVREITVLHSAGDRRVHGPKPRNR
jgi:hypothetical protein